jgi:hypothetical protein
MIKFEKYNANKSIEDRIKNAELTIKNNFKGLNTINNSTIDCSVLNESFINFTLLLLSSPFLVKYSIL